MIFSCFYGGFSELATDSRSTPAEGRIKQAFAKNTLAKLAVTFEVVASHSSGASPA